MSGSAVGAVIQSIAIVIALLGVIASFTIARRGQQQDLRLAREEADRAERAQRAGDASALRAENAAALTIDALTRIAGAMESLARRDGPSLIAPVASRVSWSLRRTEGDTFALRNTGAADAFDVRLSASDTLERDGEWPSPNVLHAGDSVTFGARRTVATTDATITVEWSTHAGSDARESWRYPLPV